MHMRDFIEIIPVGTDTCTMINVKHIIRVQDNNETSLITLNNGDKIEARLPYSLLRSILMRIEDD